jgi:hypothetical protein
MDVRIVDVLRGEPLADMITIENGDGADCRVFVGQFEEGAHYLFAFYGNPEFGYNLYHCGVTFLRIEGDVIEGKIAPGVTQIPITELVTIGNCGGIGAEVTVINVSPTLTSNIVRVKTTKDVADIDIRMFDMAGRLVYIYPFQLLPADQPVEITAGVYPQGCYIITVDALGIRETHKIMLVSG